MKVIDIEKVKKSDNKDEVFVAVVLDDSNISKISMKVLYMVESGYKNFLFDFESPGLTLTVDRILAKVQKQIFALVNSHQIKVAIKGFSECVFNRKFLHCGLRYDFGDKIFYYNPTDEIETKCDEFICMDDCCGDGFVNHYERMPEYTIEDYKISLEQEFEGFWNPNLKDVAQLCLDDYLENSSYTSRKIFFREIISSGSDDFREGFQYRIFNEPAKFKSIFKFLRKVLGPNVERYKSYLERSTNFVLSFEVRANDVMMARLFFSLNRIPKPEVEDLFFGLNIVLDNLTQVYGVDLDFTSEVAVHEIYYAYDKLDAFKAKRFFDKYDLDSKLLLFKFLNSTTKDLKNILLRDTYEDEILVSRKLDVGCAENLIKVKSIGILYSLNVGHLLTKDVSTILLEVSQFSPVKIIFNYSPALPIRLPLEVEEELEEEIEKEI